MLLSPASAGAGHGRGRSLTSDPLAGLANHPSIGALVRVVTPASPEASVSRPLSHTPPARSIDPRGQRFGAGVSATILAIALAVGLPWLALLIGANLAVSAAFGTRLFVPGRAWPAVRRALRLGPPAEPEHEYPPRFAQALGATFIGLAGLAFVAGATPLGWLLVGAVAGLQVLLATTGICVGCRLYVLRWFLPALVARLFRRADRLVGVAVRSPIRYTDR